MSITKRYIHPQQHTIREAIERTGRHKSSTPAQEETKVRGLENPLSATNCRCRALGDHSPGSYRKIHFQNERAGRGAARAHPRTHRNQRRVPENCGPARCPKSLSRGASRGDQSTIKNPARGLAHQVCADLAHSSSMRFCSNSRAPLGVCATARSHDSKHRKRSNRANASIWKVVRSSSEFPRIVLPICRCIVMSATLPCHCFCAGSPLQHCLLPPGCLAIFHRSVQALNAEDSDASGAENSPAANLFR